MITKSEATPGNVVILNRPYKPSMPDQRTVHNVSSGEMLGAVEYRYWNGYTHGIILSAESSVVYLALYDPLYATMYTDYTDNIPVRMEFSFEEVELYKISSQFPSIKGGN